MTGANKNILKLYCHITRTDVTALIQHIVAKGTLERRDIMALWHYGIPVGLYGSVEESVEGVLEYIYTLVRDAIPDLQRRYACRKSLWRLQKSVEDHRNSLEGLLESFTKMSDVAKRFMFRFPERVRTGIAPKHGRTRKKPRPTRLQRRQKRQLKKQRR